MFAYKTLLENVKLKFIKTDIKQVLQFLYKLLLFFFYYKSITAQSQ